MRDDIRDASPSPVPKPLGRVESHVGERLRQHRERLGWSRTLLARKAGLTPAAVLRYEQGIERVPPQALLPLASALDLPLVNLFDGL